MLFHTCWPLERPETPSLARRSIRSSAVGRLVDALAHEAYRQLSNRHSLNAPFLPADLVKLLKAFAEIHPTQGV